MIFLLNAWLETLLWGQSWSPTEKTEVSKSYTFNLEIVNIKGSDKNQAADILKYASKTDRYFKPKIILCLSFSFVKTRQYFLHIWGAVLSK